MFFQFLLSRDPSEIILKSFDIEIICISLYMFLLLDTFYASLLNKSINLLKHFY